MPDGDSVAFIDPSHLGRDHTALTIIKGYFQGIAAEGKTWKRSWDACLDDMVPYLVKHKVKKLAIETNGLGDMPVTILRKLLKPYGIGIVGWYSSNAKHSRIMAAGSCAHLIHLSKESDKNYTKQVIQYEFGAEPDDAPDSLATGLCWIGYIKGKD